MNFTGQDDLTKYEQWIADELTKHCTEGTTHCTDYCFEQTYRLGDMAFILGTKIFYSSLFNNPKEVRWIADRIVELPEIYIIRTILHLGLNLSTMYEKMIKNDPSFDKRLKNTYKKFSEFVNEKEELL